MPCPEIEDLERHVSEDLAGEARARVSMHLESCATCKDRLEEISSNLDALDGMKDALLEEAAAAEIPLPGRIGPFTVIREIARGGMGVVYLAEQQRPKRHVALKVLRPGVASAETLKRFELEADVLARLRHPGIAAVYEAGIVSVESAGGSDRVPYIAMEYVEGERIDRFVADREVTPAARLALLAEVADAVHHAHVKGLVHRDLKPGNVLVESRGTAAGGLPGAPKVLDFGVARVADREGRATLRTTTGQLLGTVPYMSPEQLAGDPSAVDARSDVYALGVLGYEILTGEFPYDAKKASLAEAARMIRDDDPRPPSQVDPRLRGDVETILMRALEKDPERRYPSAAEMAADIRRFLGREPIQARPQSAAYQLRRFAQRNRGLTAALGVLLLTVVSAAVVSSVLAVRASRAESLAQAQLEEARRQAEKFEAANRFLEEMLAAPSPEDNPGGGSVTVREVLDRGIEELDAGSLTGQPGIELGVRTTIGNSYRAAGAYEPARTQLERAVELGRSLYPEGHQDLAYALNKLARTIEQIGDLDRAGSLYREGLEMRRRIHGPRSEEAATSLNNLAHLLSRRGEQSKALEMHQEALEIRRELFGESHEEIANSLNNLAVLHYSMGDLEKAEPMLRESLEMDSALRGELHPNVASTMNNLAMVTAGLGRFEEAEPLHRKAIELERRIYGENHPKLAVSLMNLARLLVKLDRLDEAEPLFEEAVMLEKKARGDRHPAVANLLGNYASLFEARGEYDRAEALHRDALSIRREALGDDAVATLGSRYNLARVARDRGDLQRASRYFSRLAQDAKRILPPSSGHLFTILSAHALCLAETGPRDEAVRVLREARDAGSATAGPDDPRMLQLSEALASLESES